MDRNHIIDPSMIRDYVDRRLGATQERAFEERMLEDAELLTQVQSELALRRGLTAMERQDRTAASAPVAVAVAPPSSASADVAAAAPSTTPVSDVASLADARARRTQAPAARARRWLPYAAAAALALVALVPATVLMLQRHDQNVLEAYLNARVDPAGQQASYAVPAVYLKDASFEPVGTPTAAEDAPGPVRIRLPKRIDHIVLELPRNEGSAERRLLLVRADDPAHKLTLPGVRSVDATTFGFAIDSGALIPGRYAAQLERIEGGSWVPDRHFVLTIDQEK